MPDPVKLPGTPPTVQSWQKMAGESARAFECFSAFLLAGPDRKLVRVYRDFYGRPEAKDHSGTWKGWVRKWNWHDRAASYDRHLVSKIAPLIERQEADATLKRLEQYRDLHERCGAGGMALAANSIAVLSVYIKRFLPAAKGVEPELSIESIADARAFAQVSTQYLAGCSQIWGEALGVPELTEMVESMRLNETKEG